MRFVCYLLLTFCLGCVIVPAGAAQDQADLTFFRIATGDLDGAYAPLGGVLTNAISQPPGLTECAKSRHCGVPGLVGVARSTNGSLENIKALRAGQVDSAFVQADILYWAYEGRSMFSDQKPMQDLRVLASLYNKTIHLVVPVGSDIQGVVDLRGRRVGLGRRGSDTHIESKLVLYAFGLSENDIKGVNDKTFDNAQMLKDGQLDAMFMVTAYPSCLLQSLSRDGAIRLVSIAGDVRERLLKQHSFLRRGRIPAGVYGNKVEIETLRVPTIWVAHKKLSERLAYQLLTALWHDTARQLMERSNDLARQVTYGTSFEGVAIPLHKGAMLFHEEREIKKAQRIYALDQKKEGSFRFLRSVFARNPKQE